MTLAPLLAITLALASATARAAPADDNPLARWVGKYPSDAATGHGPLLRQPALASTLRTLLPRPEAAALAAFDTESKVRRVGDLLVIDQCRPHACPADAAMIVVDLASTRVWAAFFTRSAQRVATRWYGNEADWPALPAEIRDDFLARHASAAP